MITPSYMLALLDEFRREGIDPKSSGLSIGIFGAEPWGEGIRQEIESAFGIDACDIYGLSEVMGPGVAQEFARTKEGPTIWEDHFLPEIVDPVSGVPLAPGEPGSSCSPRSPRKPCRWCAIAPATSHVCFRAMSPRCADSPRSRAAPTIC